MSFGLILNPVVVDGTLTAAQKEENPKLLFGMNDWPDRLRDHTAIYRELAERTDDPIVKNELLDLASVCAQVSGNIEDRPVLSFGPSWLPIL